MNEPREAIWKLIEAIDWAHMAWKHGELFRLKETMLHAKELSDSIANEFPRPPTPEGEE